jgi:hypothetical protein
MVAGHLLVWAAVGVAQSFAAVFAVVRNSAAFLEPVVVGQSAVGTAEVVTDAEVMHSAEVVFVGEVKRNAARRDWQNYLRPRQLAL